MPTGYTAKIEEDPDFTFERFVWTCASAFIPQMKEARPTARIPERFDLDPYYAKCVAEAKADLDRFKAMNPEEYVTRAEASFPREAAEWEKSDKERRKLVALYDAMLAKVEAWRLPSKDHEGLKAFMAEQIDTSVRYMRNPYSKPTAPPTLAEAKERLAEEIKWAEESLERAERRHEEAIRGNKHLNEWLRMLQESVPQP